MNTALLIPQPTRLSVLMDMAGCPNRCRHCWLGHHPNRPISKETLRQTIAQIRRWTHPRGIGLGVCTWYREPDFSPDYRQLWELEQELSDLRLAERFELLSIWRLARDPDYAGWARQVGTAACQITFFGLQTTTDRFFRRRGAFQDNLTATTRLIAADIRPRWQVFVTTHLLPDLQDLLDLTRSPNWKTSLQFFVNLPTPYGEAWHIEHLRPTAADLARLPVEWVDMTLEHFGASSLEECLGKSEEDWLPELLEDDRPAAICPERLALMVTPELNVYANMGELTPWWKWGNLAADGIEAVMRPLQADTPLRQLPPGLVAHFQMPVSELARTYGRPHSRQIYSRDDLIARWTHMWGQEQAAR